MERLFHATAVDFAGPKPGGYDKVFWTAETSAVAQSYIPSAPFSALWTPQNDRCNQNVMPDLRSLEYQIVVTHMGITACNIVTDRCGNVRSFMMPEGYPTYGEVTDFIAGKLGYDVSGQVRLKMKLDSNGLLKVIPARENGDGWLWIVEGAQHLRIYDMAKGRESCFLDPDYHRLELFRSLEEQGWDGVRINDTTSSETWGNVHHPSVGFFGHAIEKLRFTKIGATEFDWPDYRSAITDVDKTPEYLEWLAQEEGRPLYKLQATLRRGEAAVVSDRVFERMVDEGLFDADFVSAFNPLQCGTLDSLVIGRKTAEQVRKIIETREATRHAA